MVSSLACRTFPNKGSEFSIFPFALSSTSTLRLSIGFLVINQKTILFSHLLRGLRVEIFNSQGEYFYFDEAGLRKNSIAWK